MPHDRPPTTPKDPPITHMVGGTAQQWGAITHMWRRGMASIAAEDPQWALDLAEMAEPVLEKMRQHLRHMGKTP